jgi:hypothetical protein
MLGYGIIALQMLGVMKKQNVRDLRGSPCKNRPLEFRKITEFFDTFCVEEVIHKMNKKHWLWNCSQFLNFFRNYFRTRSKTS